MWSSWILSKSSSLLLVSSTLPTLAFISLSVTGVLFLPHNPVWQVQRRKHLGFGSAREKVSVLDMVLNCFTSFNRNLCICHFKR